MSHNIEMTETEIDGVRNNNKPRNGIDKFPEEVLLEIFEFLDFSDLLTATEVCKSWNDLISKSKYFLSRTRFDIKPNCSLSRPYKHVQFFERILEHTELTLQVLSSIASNLVEIVIQLFSNKIR